MMGTSASPPAFSSQSPLHNDWKLWSSAEAELRVNPPNVRVDNKTSTDATIITVDSANRSGVLLEVVQTLTEMGYTINKAIISSDGGWFVDVFHVVTEEGRKITNTVALQRIEKMLASEAPAIGKTSISGLDQTALTPGPMPGPAKYAVIELSMSDRHGLLSDVTALLAKQHLSVISAATWSQHTRAAMVLFVEVTPGFEEADAAWAPLSVSPLPPLDGLGSTPPSPLSTSASGSLTRHGGVGNIITNPFNSQPQAPLPAPLQRERLAVVKAVLEAEFGAMGSVINVNVGLIHDRDNVDLDRRLHRVLTTPVRRHTRLNESMESMDGLASMAMGMAKIERENSSNSAEMRRFSLLAPSTDSLGGDSNGLPLLLPTNSTPNLKITTSEPDLSASPAYEDDLDVIGGSMRLPGRSNAAAPTPSSPLPSTQPKDTSVTIDNDMYPGYSLVTVSCQDRNALLFDTVCVLFVSNYDVNHATIETTAGWAYMEFYVRTKMGVPILLEEQCVQLRAGLLAACARKGAHFRLELSAHDRPGLLADVTKKLADSGLTITKSEVSMQGPRAVEKFVVESDASKEVDAVSMHKVCMEIGQTLLEGGSVHYTQAVTPRASLYTGAGGGVAARGGSGGAGGKARAAGAGAAGKAVRGAGDLNSSDAVLDTWISSGWA